MIIDEQEEEEVIVGGLNQLKLSTARSRENLASFLIRALALIVLVYYLLVFILICWGKAQVDLLKEAFQITIPTLAGFTGIAIAHFFPSSNNRE